MLELWWFDWGSSTWFWGQSVSKSVISLTVFNGSVITYPGLPLAIPLLRDRLPLLSPDPLSDYFHPKQTDIYAVPGPRPALCCTHQALLCDALMWSVSVNTLNVAVSHRWRLTCFSMREGITSKVSIFTATESPRQASLSDHCLLSLYRLRPLRVTGLHVRPPVPPTLKIHCG